MDQPGHQPASLQLAMDQPGAKAPGPSQQPWEYRLRKYLLLLSTLVVTVTYAAGFNPPGGNWQEGAHGGRLAGDPIIRDIHYHRYLAFFYCNATAFAASLVVIVLILILATRHNKEKDITWVASEVKPLRAVMVLDLLSLVGAYAAGTCRDKISTVYSVVLVAMVFIYLVVLKFRDWWSRHKKSNSSAMTAAKHTSGPGKMPYDSDGKVEEKGGPEEDETERKALQGLHASRHIRGEHHLHRRAEHAGWLLGHHRGQPPPGRCNPQGPPQPAPDGVFVGFNPRIFFGNSTFF